MSSITFVNKQGAMYDAMRMYKIPPHNTIS